MRCGATVVLEAANLPIFWADSPNTPTSPQPFDAACGVAQDKLPQRGMLGSRALGDRRSQLLEIPAYAGMTIGKMGWRVGQGILKTQPSRLRQAAHDVEVLDRRPGRAFAEIVQSRGQATL